MDLLGTTDPKRIACVALVADEYKNLRNDGTLPCISGLEFEMVGGKSNGSIKFYSLYRQLVTAYRYVKAWIKRKKFPSSAHIIKANKLFTFTARNDCKKEENDDHMKRTHSSAVMRILIMFRLLRKNINRKMTCSEVLQFMHTYELSDSHYIYCGGIKKKIANANKKFILQFEYMLNDIQLFFNEGRFPPYQVLCKVHNILQIPEYDIRTYNETDDEEIDNLDGAPLWNDTNANIISWKSNRDQDAGEDAGEDAEDEDAGEEDDDEES